MPLTKQDIQGILGDVRFLDRHFEVMEKGDGFLIQLSYLEVCVYSGAVVAQKGRKWYVSPHSTKSEVVQTCLKACLTSMEHSVREHFLYKGARVYGPHFDVDKLLALTAEDGATVTRT